MSAGRCRRSGQDAVPRQSSPTVSSTSLFAFLERYEISFSGTFRKVVNAGKNLRYARVEPRVRVVPFFVGSERTAYWNAKVQEDICGEGADRPLRIRGSGRAPLPTSPTAGSGTSRRVQGDPDIVLKVELATALGGRFGATPIEISMPVMIAPMSYGALSKSTKVALGKASGALGHLRQLGRGRPRPRGSRAAKRVVVQMLGGRFGWFRFTRCAPPMASRSTSRRAPSPASAAS